MKKLFLFLALLMGTSTTSSAVVIELRLDLWPSAVFTCGSQAAAEQLIYGLSVMNPYQLAGLDSPNRYVRESRCELRAPPPVVEKIRDYKLLLINNRWVLFHLYAYVWDKKKYFMVRSDILPGEET